MRKDESSLEKEGYIYIPNWWSLEFMRGLVKFWDPYMHIHINTFEISKHKLISLLQCLKHYFQCISQEICLHRACLLTSNCLHGILFLSRGPFCLLHLGETNLSDVKVVFSPWNQMPFFYLAASLSSFYSTEEMLLSNCLPVMATPRQEGTRV